MYFVQLHFRDKGHLVVLNLAHAHGSVEDDDNPGGSTIRFPNYSVTVKESVEEILAMLPPQS